MNKVSTFIYVAVYVCVLHKNNNTFMLDIVPVVRPGPSCSKAD